MRIIFILLISFFLCSCDSLLNHIRPKNENSILKNDSELKKEIPNKKEPFIYLVNSGQKINLVEFNQSSQELGFQDRIFFPAFLKDSKIKVSSICTSLSEKITKNFKEFEYQSSFEFLQFSSDEILTDFNDNSFSCSFIFTLTNENEIYHYIVTQQSFISSYRGNGLVLVNENYRAINTNFPIRSDEVESVLLIKKDSKFPDKYELICNDFEKQIFFNLTHMNSFIFSYILSQNELPKGKRYCRIISRKSKLVDGTTQLFQINFSNLISKKELDIENIQYSLIHKGNESLTVFNQPFNDPLIVNKNKIEQDKIYPFSVIRFKNLPSDFHLGHYKDAQIKVSTTCSEDLFLNPVEREYQFPLTEEFSLMSVTPIEFFQLFYLEKNKQILLYELNTSIGDPLPIHHKRKNEKKHLRKNTSCIYKISLESMNSNGQTIIKSYPDQSHVLDWDSSGYGVNIINHFYEYNLENFEFSFESQELANSINKKYLSFYEINQEMAGNFNLTFLNQFAYKNYWNSYPDKMRLLCGSDSDSKKSFQLDFSQIDRLGSSIPFSVIFSHSSIKNYTADNKIIKCRLLFLKNGGVQYFSSEFRIFQ